MKTHQSYLYLCMKIYIQTRAIYPQHHCLAQSTHFHSSIYLPAHCCDYKYVPPHPAILFLLNGNHCSEDDRRKNCSKEVRVKKRREKSSNNSAGLSCWACSSSGSRGTRYARGSDACPSVGLPQPSFSTQTFKITNSVIFFLPSLLS